MYEELYQAWKRELEDVELVKLPSDFYQKIADYLRNLTEEGRMLDQRSVKARLLKKESRNAKRMLRELLGVRYEKTVAETAKSERGPLESWTPEEKEIFQSFSSVMETYQSFSKGLLKGQISIAAGKEPKNAALRFLKEVPEIVGSDIKTYGPFKVEDVGSLPMENAKILIKQGMAERIEVS
jgi:DNA replication initiation complex subunit (GINS family)